MKILVLHGPNLNLLGTPRWYQGATRADGSLDPLLRRSPPRANPISDSSHTPAFLWSIPTVDLTPCLAALLLLATALLDRFAAARRGDRRWTGWMSDAMALLAIGSLTAWLVPEWLILCALLIAPVWSRVPFRRGRLA